MPLALLLESPATALSIAVKTLSDGVDGVMLKMSPLAGVPEIWKDMPGTVAMVLPLW